MTAENSTLHDKNKLHFKKYKIENYGSCFLTHNSDFKKMWVYWKFISRNFEKKVRIARFKLVILRNKIAKYKPAFLIFFLELWELAIASYKGDSEETKRLFSYNC